MAGLRGWGRIAVVACVALTASVSNAINMHVEVCADKHGFNNNGDGKGARVAEDGFPEGSFIAIQPPTTVSMSMFKEKNFYANAGGASVTNNWCRLCGCLDSSPPKALEGVNSWPEENNIGTLMYKVDDNDKANEGNWHPVGTYTDFIMPASNNLYLGYWDINSKDNSGCINVTVAVQQESPCESLEGLDELKEMLTPDEENTSEKDEANFTPGLKLRTKVCATVNGFGNGGFGIGAFAGEVQAETLVTIQAPPLAKWSMFEERGMYSNAAGASPTNSWCMLCGCKDTSAPTNVEGINAFPWENNIGTLMYKLDSSDKASDGEWHPVGVYTDVYVTETANLYYGFWDVNSLDNGGCITVKTALMLKEECPMPGTPPTTVDSETETQSPNQNSTIEEDAGTGTSTEKEAAALDEDEGDASGADADAGTDTEKEDTISPAKDEDTAADNEEEVTVSPVEDEDTATGAGAGSVTEEEVTSSEVDEGTVTGTGTGTGTVTEEEVTGVTTSPSAGGVTGAPSAGGVTGAPAGGVTGAPSAGGVTGAPSEGRVTGASSAGGDTGAPSAGGDTGAPSAGGVTGAPSVGRVTGTLTEEEVTSSLSGGEDAGSAAGVVITNSSTGGGASSSSSAGRAGAGTSAGGVGAGSSAGGVGAGSSTGGVSAGSSAGGMGTGASAGGVGAGFSAGGAGAGSSAGGTGVGSPSRDVVMGSPPKDAEFGSPFEVELAEAPYEEGFVGGAASPAQEEADGIPFDVVAALSPEEEKVDGSSSGNEVGASLSDEEIEGFLAELENGGSSSEDGVSG